MLQKLRTSRTERIYCAYVSWYMILFGVYCVMTRFTITNLAIDGLANSILYVGFAVVGAFLAAFEFFVYGSMFKEKLDRLLILFFLISVVSTLLNFRYDFTGNVKALVIFFSQIMIYYYLSRHLTKEAITNMLKRFFFLINFLWCIASVGSLVLFLLDMRFPLAYTEGRTIRQGFVDGRLFGFFSDPNFAAFTSLLILYGLLFCLRNTKNKLFRITIYASAVIHCLYIVMSNSRSVYIAVVLSALLYNLLRKKQKEGTLSLLSIVKNLVFTTVFLAVIYGGVFLTAEITGSLLSPDGQITEKLVRDDVSMENISNNRLTIWTNYLKLFAKKPILGTSPRGALLLADETEPTGYLSTTQYVTHNGYISLLVTTGALGFLVMACFFILVLLRVRKTLKSETPPDDLYVLFLILIVASCIFTCFFTDLFFTNNLETILVFTGLGYIVHHSK